MREKLFQPLWKITEAMGLNIYWGLVPAGAARSPGKGKMAL